MKHPHISVIIPVYNGAPYLAEAIQSVLAQAPRPDEILVVDNGSTDTSVSIAQSFGPPVRVCNCPERGAAAARNRGLTEAQGEWLAFLDADDVWVAGKLAWQSAALAADPALDAVFGHAEQFISRELDAASRAALHCPTEPLPAWLPSALLIRRAACLRVGPFDTKPQVAEVMDWLMRARELGLRMQMLPEVVYRRRLHHSNQGVLKRDQRQDYVRVLKAALDRRRQRASGGKPTQ